MFQAPDLYNSINECQKRDSLIALETYKHWLGDSSGQRILDVGSGSGNVTMEILLPRLSKHFISLVSIYCSFSDKYCNYLTPLCEIKGQVNCLRR